jgi:hypothetical protein
MGKLALINTAINRVMNDLMKSAAGNDRRQYFNVFLLSGTDGFIVMFAGSLSLQFVITRGISPVVLSKHQKAVQQAHGFIMHKKSCLSRTKHAIIHPYFIR